MPSAVYSSSLFFFFFLKIICTSIYFCFAFFFTLHVPSLLKNILPDATVRIMKNSNLQAVVFFSSPLLLTNF